MGSQDQHREERRRPGLADAVTAHFEARRQAALKAAQKPAEDGKGNGGAPDAA